MAGRQLAWAPARGGGSAGIAPCDDHDSSLAADVPARPPSTDRPGHLADLDFAEALQPPLTRLLLAITRPIQYSKMILK
jgi:hypothetical protein